MRAILGPSSRVPAAALVVAGIALAVFLAFNEPAARATAEAGVADLAGAGILDGMSFDSELGPLHGPPDVQDTLVFENGLFVSTECERRCDYPARPYFVRHGADGIEFVSETRCPYKDASIVWRGTVTDGAIEGVATWTVSRWYWTIERQLRFTGVVARRDAGGPSG